MQRERWLRRMRDSRRINKEIDHCKTWVRDEQVFVCVWITYDRVLCEAGKGKWKFGGRNAVVIFEFANFVIQILCVGRSLELTEQTKKFEISSATSDRMWLTCAWQSNEPKRHLFAVHFTCFSRLRCTCLPLIYTHSRSNLFEHSLHSLVRRRATSFANKMSQDPSVTYWRSQRNKKWTKDEIKKRLWWCLISDYRTSRSTWFGRVRSKKKKKCTLFANLFFVFVWLLVHDFLDMKMVGLITFVAPCTLLLFFVSFLFLFFFSFCDGLTWFVCPVAYQRPIKLSSFFAFPSWPESWV